MIPKAGQGSTQLARREEPNRARALEGSGPAPLPIADAEVIFADRPANQPVNRFRGHDNIPERAPDALPPWLATPFRKLGVILEPIPESDWQSKHVFNPAAIVKDGKVHLLYRAEDNSGIGVWNGTSRIGLAVSDDGIHFERRPTPVLGPTEWYEIPGGCEDPRVVFLDGRYVMTYTAFDGKTARLAIAESHDLVHWEKKGLAFPELGWNPILKDHPNWSKSGGIVPERINGEYVMYFGEGDIFIATSPDGLHWKHETEPILRRREGHFDMLLAEPGPTPWVDREGIHLLYNGDAPPDGYAVGEVVFDRHYPRRIVRRSTTPFLKPTEEFEITGQVGNVIFAEGFVMHRGKALLYYGAADGKIAVASADLPQATNGVEVLAEQRQIVRARDRQGWRASFDKA